MKKITFGATCGAGVALAWQNGVLWVAFPGGGGLGGAAPNYRLNVMPVQPNSVSDEWSLARLLVLEETTTEQPALAVFGGQLWVAWTGTDPAHRLNLVPLNVDRDSRLTAGAKIVLNWTATGGPALLASESELRLAFCGGGGLAAARPNGALNYASSTDGHDWPASRLTVFTQYHSLLSPSLAQWPADAAGPADPLIAFTGTNHLLYLVDTQSPDQVEILQEVTQVTRESNGNSEVDEYYETSDFAPSLGVFDNQGSWERFYVWTGSGNNRHLYYMGEAGLEFGAAEVDASGAPIARGSVQHQAFPDTSAFAPAVLGVGRSRYVAWAGTDPVHRLNIWDFGDMQSIGT